MSKVTMAALFALTVSLLVGCGPMELRRDVSEIAPKLDDVPGRTQPLHAGVYYGPEFADQEHVRVVGTVVFIVPIGAASAQLFDECLPKVFAKTSRISSLSPEVLAAKGIDVAISPTLEYFNWRHGFDSDGPSKRWSVSYRLTLFSPQAVPVASWIVSGDDAEGDGGFAGAQKDLKDACAKFLSGFEHNAGPALAAIARNKGKRVATINTRDVVLTASSSQLPGLDPRVTAALQKAGVATIRLAAKSTSERDLLVRASDTRLRLKDGRLIEPSSIPSILNLLQDKDEGFNAWFFGGIIGGIVDTQAQGEQQAEDSQTLNRTLFSERTLTRGKEESGFLLFRMPKGAQASGGATLTAWIVDPMAADGVQIDAPVKSAP